MQSRLDLITMSSTKSFVLNLISQLESMSKSQHDEQLSEVLDRFIKSVEDSDEYLDNGIFNINFAEVALFLQNCVQLYGKKVDSLWDHAFEYQKQIIALERESTKREQAEILAKERQLRYKRKRKIEETNEKTNINELLQLSVNIQKLHVKPCENLQKAWTYAQVRNRNYSQDTTTEERCFRDANYLITSPINSDCDGVINFDKMKLNNTVFEVTQGYPEFVGRTEGKNPLNVTHFYETDVVLQAFLVKENVSLTEVEKIYRDNYKMFYLEHLAAKAKSASADTSNTFYKKRLITHVEHLSEDVPQQCLKRDPALISAKIKRASSTAPSLGGNDSGFFDYTGEDDETENSLREDVTLSLSSENSEHALSVIEDLPIELQSEINYDDSATIMEHNFDVLSTEKTVIVEEFKSCNKRKSNRMYEKSYKKRKPNFTYSDEEDEEEEEPLIYVKKRRNAATRPKIKLTVSLRTFENFMQKHYKPQVGEASLDFLNETPYEEIETNTEELQDENDDSESSNVEDIETTSLSECDFQPNTNERISTPAEVNNNREIEKQTEPTQSAQLSQTVMKSLEQEKRQREKVEEWKMFITKKLDKLNEKADFDIHYYGSQIMNNISENENKKFSDIVQGKNGSEVCRYFLATLQLACTENVEIINPFSDRIANNNLKLKLLSRECYYENLANYVAPSEETFDERLAKARRHRRQK